MITGVWQGGNNNQVVAAAGQWQASGGGVVAVAGERGRFGSNGRRVVEDW